MGDGGDGGVGSPPRSAGGAPWIWRAASAAAPRGIRARERCSPLGPPHPAVGPRVLGARSCPVCRLAGARRASWTVMVRYRCAHTRSRPSQPPQIARTRSGSHDGPARVAGAPSVVVRRATRAISSRLANPPPPPTGGERGREIASQDGAPAAYARTPPACRPATASSARAARRTIPTAALNTHTVRPPRAPHHARPLPSPTASNGPSGPNSHLDAYRAPRSQQQPRCARRAQCGCAPEYTPAAGPRPVTARERSGAELAPRARTRPRPSPFARPRRSRGAGCVRVGLAHARDSISREARAPRGEKPRAGGRRGRRAAGVPTGF